MTKFNIRKYFMANRIKNIMFGTLLIVLGIPLSVIVLGYVFIAWGIIVIIVGGIFGFVNEKGLKRKQRKKAKERLAGKHNPSRMKAGSLLRD